MSDSKKTEQLVQKVNQLTLEIDGICKQIYQQVANEREFSSDKRQLLAQLKKEAEKDPKVRELYNKCLRIEKDYLRRVKLNTMHNPVFRGLLWIETANNLNEAEKLSAEIMTYAKKNPARYGNCNKLLGLIYKEHNNILKQYKLAKTYKKKQKELKQLKEKLQKTETKRKGTRSTMRL